MVNVYLSSNIDFDILTCTLMNKRLREINKEIEKQDKPTLDSLYGINDEFHRINFIIERMLSS